MVAQGPFAPGPPGSPGEASIASEVEQKVSALSRRTAAELRRAERERGDHAGRLEVLEELCRKHLGGLEERLVHAREDAVSEVERVSKGIRQRFEINLQAMSEAFQQHSVEAQEQASVQLMALAKRMDADHDTLEDLQAWRRKADQRFSAVHENQLAPRGQGQSEEVVERFEEQLEASISRERKQAHERLRSSCAELTAHLNELRRELMEQRRVVEQSADQLEERREHQRANLETQIAELGGALASRLQAKIASTNKALEDQLREVRREICQSFGALEERSATLEGSDEWLGSQVQLWRRENGELHASLQGLQEMIRRESEQAVEAAREEARTVHLEVMSVDTRVASIEERLALQRRYSAPLQPMSRSPAPFGAYTGGLEKLSPTKPFPGE